MIDARIPPRPGESYKARDRRLATDWFNRFAPASRSGIDIGAGPDPLNDTFRRWDLADGDATAMAGVPDGVFRTVYASHCLEHLHDPAAALRNWWRILAAGGHLIVVVPHRDLYEKRTTLPSRWNPDHKTFWLPDRDEPPATLGFRRVLSESVPAADVVSFAVLADGFIDPGPDFHSHGEYSIEAVLWKRPNVA